MKQLRKLSIRFRLWLQIVMAMVGIATITLLALAQLKSA